MEGGRRWAMQEEEEGCRRRRRRDAGEGGGGMQEDGQGEGWDGVSPAPLTPHLLPCRAAVPPAAARGERGAAPAGTEHPQGPERHAGRCLAIPTPTRPLNPVRHRRAGGGLGSHFPLYIPLGTRRFKPNAQKGLFLQNVSPRRAGREARGVPALGTAHGGFGVGPTGRSPISTEIFLT